MASNIQPRIVKLYPMRVASVRAVGKEPEIEAFRLMANWARELGVLKAEGTRFFGFDNPAPSGYGGDYGYEVWMTVGDDIQGTEDIKIKNVTGGSYAVTRTTLENIMATWMNHQVWMAWLEANDAAHDDTRHLLEEVLLDASDIDKLLDPELDVSSIELDLYLLPGP